MRGSLCLLLTGLLAISMLSIPPVRAAPPSDEGVHVVQPGETLSSIAMKYGITVEALMRANGIVDPNRIYVGQQLTIPDTDSEAMVATDTYHIVQLGESLYTIAARYGLSAEALAQANGISDPHLIYVGQRLRIAEGSPTVARSHVVQQGETLAGIALQHGVRISGLARANGLRNPNLIYVGQRLSVPVDEFQAAARPAPPASKLIEIDISDQRMTVWENGQVKWQWVCSTGEPSRPTQVGRFGVMSKIPTAYSSYYGLQMPFWLGVYWAGGSENGIHALPISASGRMLWAGLLGRRVSYGCIILDTANARALYNWADMGTPVDIHY